MDSHPAPFFLPTNTSDLAHSSNFFDNFSAAEIHPHIVSPFENEEHSSSSNMPNQSSDSTLPPLRCSLRPHNPPSHLKDYVSTYAINAHWCILVYLDSLSSFHTSYILLGTTH